MCLCRFCKVVVSTETLGRLMYVPIRAVLAFLETRADEVEVLVLFVSGL